MSDKYIVLASRVPSKILLIVFRIADPTNGRYLLYIVTKIAFKIY